MRKTFNAKIRRYGSIGFVAIFCLVFDSSSEAHLKEKNRTSFHRKPATPQNRPVEHPKYGKVSNFFEVEPEDQGPQSNECFLVQQPTLVIVTSHPNEVPNFLKKIEPTGHGQVIVFPVTRSAITSSLIETSRKELSKIKRQVRGFTTKMAELRGVSDPAIRSLGVNSATDFFVGIAGPDGQIQTGWTQPDSNREVSDRYNEQLRNAKSSAPIPNRCPASLK